MRIGSAAYLPSSAMALQPSRGVVNGAASESSSSLRDPASSGELASPSETRAADTLGTGASATRQTRQQEQQDLQEIAELAARDREVRAHEQAHASVGAAYAGSPSYSFKRGPDGQSYAVGGEVGIDVSAVADDPEATLRKMEVVQRAALAPADPSAQDRRVAAEAAAQAGQALVELAQMRREEAAEEAARKAEARAEADDASESSPPGASQDLGLYLKVARSDAPGPLLDIRA
ncbi:putative metalloprotease CJM1_0395 family protein [Pseudomonas tohonis]|uniref:putative metalloprotease CJM1_0395 family protein n=1 Tax=Pseudomonas tohonis TaxID=2725477 RepID=UPI0022F1150E|nr:putative metalloprotease CJM1_0395 family protein [Pseudomonas tohonis]